MTDRLGEALASPSWGTLTLEQRNVILAAARAWHARQSPDYQVALTELRRARPQWTPFLGDYEVVRNIVDAALSDTAAASRQGDTHD